MLFNSYAFLFLFLPAFLLAWQITCSNSRNPAHAAAIVLLVVSLVFYGLWGLPFLALLLILTAMNYGFGQILAQPEEADGVTWPFRKITLVAALCLNVLPLVWFKYSWFVISNLALLFRVDPRFEPPALPPGISFYTFIQIAWLVGVYHRQFVPAGLMRHALFTSCFPYVISGPIVRYEQIDWQLDSLKRSNSEGLARGFSLFSMGLAKKVLLADSIGFYADAVFNAAEKAWPLSCLEGWLGSFCYTFQLYFDFSGYTDMALGLGLMIGLRLPENFNSPYKATGIIEFWRRWHMTLSAWLRDFLYIPMGGNRKGRLRQYRNLFLTMLIGGAWHGAGWTYIIWGGLHGFMLVVNHLFRTLVKGRRAEKFAGFWLVRIFFIIFTFLCLDFCWVVFRATSLDAALAIYEAMFSFGPADGAAGWLPPDSCFQGWQPFAMLGACAFICWFPSNSHEILRGRKDGRPSWPLWRPAPGWAACLALLAAASLVLLSRQTAFLYFQF